VRVATAELRKVVDRLQPGDALVVTRRDRLARSARDLLNVLDAVKQAGAGSGRSRTPGRTPRCRTASSAPCWAGSPSSSAC
jgi:hypothetical protein